jgi:hypothetical protein
MTLIVIDPRSVFHLRRHSVRRSSGLVAAVLSGLLLLLHLPASAIAQSGSVGGSIGKGDKSISGSQEPARSVPPEQPAPRVKNPSRTSGGGGGGGGGGSFDGAWAVSSVGVTCSGGSQTAVVVTSGKIIGQGVTGQVSPNGAVSTVSNSNGITIISTGKLSGRSGSGSFRQSDGCTGRWTAMKQ